MDSAGEPSAKRQAMARSPVKDASKAPMATATAHLIHTPPDRASRAVPDSPPGIDVAGGAAEKDMAYVLTKRKERESTEQHLIGRIAAAETEITRLKTKADHLEPLEAHVHDLDVFAKINTS